MKIAAIPVLLALMVACDAKSDAAASKAEPKAAEAQAPKAVSVEAQAPEAEPEVAKAAPKPEPQPEPEPAANPYEGVTLEDAKQVVVARGYKVGKVTTPLENVTVMAFEKKAKPLPITGAIVFREDVTDATALVGNNSVSATVLSGPRSTVGVRHDDTEERAAILADLAKKG